MTREQLDPENWRLTFPEPEAWFIIHVLAQLARHYQEDVTKMSPALRAYWQGRISPGDIAHDDELSDAQDMLAESREEMRSDRLKLIETWVRAFERAENRNPWTMELTAAERDEFVSMLNDRRLHLAFQSGITENDMEIEPAEIAEEQRRLAVMEIDDLGYFIMATLGRQIHHL